MEIAHEIFCLSWLHLKVPLYQFDLQIPQWLSQNHYWTVESSYDNNNVNKTINIKKKFKYKKENDNYTLYGLEWGVVGDVSDEGKWSIKKIAPWFFQENITIMKCVLSIFICQSFVSKMVSNRSQGKFTYSCTSVLRSVQGKVISQVDGCFSKKQLLVKGLWAAPRVINFSLFHIGPIYHTRKKLSLHQRRN